MRPHVNAYCAHENVNKPLRQQVFSNTHPGTSAFQQQLTAGKWSTNCYHGPVAFKGQQQQQPPPPPQQQQQAKLPLHFQQAPATYQILPPNPHAHHQHHVTHQQSSQAQAHAHLQRLSHFQHGNGFVGHATALQASMPAPPPLPLPPTQHLPEGMTHNYAKLPTQAVNQQRINECAGIPLISHASTHVAPTQRQRVMRKSAPTPNYAWGMQPTVAYGNNMPQLAGLPLLHNNNNNQKNWSPTFYEMQAPAPFPLNTTYAAYNYNNTQTHTNVKLEKSRLLRYQNSAPAALNALTNQTPTQVQDQDQSVCSTKTTTTTTGEITDQLNRLSDTCLPRIIKPRKRRKKERKPITTTTTTTIKPLPTTKTNTDLTNVGHFQSEVGGNYLWNADSENLRSIWDYPLRRSFSDSTTTTAEFRSTLSSSSESSASSSSSTCSSGSSSASSYASTYSSTDSFDLINPLTSARSRADIVGVIGSNLASQPDNQAESALNIPTKPILSVCLSDSNDSGYGDILTGINIVNDLFGGASKTSDSFALLSGLSQIPAANAKQTTIATTTTNSDNAADLLLLPETAETLLNESINEISRKLIETCGNELPDFNNELPRSAASLSCSEFSNDSNSNNNNSKLIFNFDHLTLSDDSQNQATAQFSSMDNFFRHLHNKNNIDENNNNNHKETQILPNCLDMMWPNSTNIEYTPPLTYALNSYN